MTTSAQIEMRMQTIKMNMFEERNTNDALLGYGQQLATLAVAYQLAIANEREAGKAGSTQP